MDELSLATEIQIALRADALRSDVVRGLVWFLNYSAVDPTAVTSKQLDLHGTGMLPGDVEIFAHRWLAFSRSVDIDHDGIGRPVQVVESFFNSKDVSSPSWPINTHAVRMDLSGSSEAMDGFKTGRLNCVSLDAFTFNVKRRLPVAAQEAASLAMKSVDPVELALELAKVGFDGIDGAVALSKDLVIVTRGALTPLGVQISADEIEVTASGGAWAAIAAKLITSGSLKLINPVMRTAPVSVPDHGGIQSATDFAPWNPADIEKLLAPTGIDLLGSEPITPFAFIREDGTGELPHHTIRGVNIQAVKDCLAKVDQIVPPDQREAVRAHLVSHLRMVS